MTIKNWVSCLGDTSEIYFSVWKNDWISVESVKELTDKFGDEIIKSVSVYNGNFDVYIDFYITD